MLQHMKTLMRENLIFLKIYKVGSRWKTPARVLNFFQTCPVLIPQQYLMEIPLSWTQTLLEIMKISEPWKKASHHFLALMIDVTLFPMKWITFKEWLAS